MTPRKRTGYQRRYQAALRRVLASYRADLGEDDYHERLTRALEEVDREPHGTALAGAPAP